MNRMIRITIATTFVLGMGAMLRDSHWLDITMLGVCLIMSLEYIIYEIKGKRP